MYKFKILLFLLSFSSAIPAYSNNSGWRGGSHKNSNLDGTTCSLPAPTGLQVTNVTSNSITVQWLPVPGAAEFVATAFDSLSNVALGPPVVTTGTTAVMTGLPSGSSIKIEVAARCTVGGPMSTNKAVIYQRTDIVIEIVNLGYECPHGTSWSSYPIESGVTISVPIQIGVSYLCEMTKTNTGLTSKFDLKTITNPSSKMQMGPITTNLGTLGGGGNSAMFVNMSGYVVCVFKVTSTSFNSAQLNITGPSKNFIPGYTFKIITCGANFQQVEDRENDVKYTGNTNNKTGATISPNPFTDRLQVQFPEGDKEGEAKIQLFHINGTLLQTKKQALADGNSCELLTETLPAGMYLLRIETPEGSITRLVTKMGR